MITPDLTSFLESGVSILLGTRDNDFVPDCSRGMGARVESATEITVFLPEATSASMLANLAANQALAACFTHIDHRAIQLKGRVVAIRPATPDDYTVIDRYRNALAEPLNLVGLSPRQSLRMVHRPCRAVRLAIEAIYLQTPGPRAGELMTGGQDLR